MYEEILFRQCKNVNQREKARKFWEFIDQQDDLRPYIPASKLLVPKRKKKQAGKNMSKPKLKNVDMSVMEKVSWCNELNVFHRLGLPTIAFSTNVSCKLCSAQASFECFDFADMVPQSYEELNAELKIFEERLNDAHKITDDIKQKRSSRYTKNI
ncbi:hypothetical protein KM043_009787 [Ampulex compressa]|nr:hypothetical protein KM043_009787 [Ampulex compressa]